MDGQTDIVLVGSQAQHQVVPLGVAAAGQIPQGASQRVGRVADTHPLLPPPPIPVPPWHLGLVPPRAHLSKLKSHQGTVSPPPLTSKCLPHPLG